jgi:hypothetical protein
MSDKITGMSPIYTPAPASPKAAPDGLLPFDLATALKWPERVLTRDGTTPKRFFKDGITVFARHADDVGWCHDEDGVCVGNLPECRDRDLFLRPIPAAPEPTIETAAGNAICPHCKGWYERAVGHRCPAAPEPAADCVEQFANWYDGCLGARLHDTRESAVETGKLNGHYLATVRVLVPKPTEKPMTPTTDDPRTDQGE